jgi:hypothetical protein
MRPFVSILIAGCLILVFLVCSCAQSQQPQPLPQPTAKPEQPAQPEPVAPQEHPKPADVPQAPETNLECGRDLEPQQIRDIRTSLEDTGLQKTEEGFSFRVFPVDETGTKVIPVEGTITVTVYSTQEDDPLKSEYSVYSKSFYVKKENVLADCGPAAVTIPWSKIADSSNYRYIKTPNPGMITIQFTRTGSEQLFEQTYYAAEHNEYLIT